jgi:hypothetical protein
MSITEINDRVPIVKAIEECKRLGREPFLKNGFGRARSYRLVFEGHFYDSKAIVGVAYGFLPGSPGPLKPQDFSGGDKTVRRLLEGLGFVVEADETIADP